MLAQLVSFPKAIHIIAGFCIVACILLLDYITGVELSFSIFYFLPILLVSWFVGKNAGISFSFLCAGAWAYAEYAGGNSYSSQYIFVFNSLVRLGIFLTVALLLVQLKRDTLVIHQNEVLKTRSVTVIATSQRITALIAKNIVDINSKLWHWIVEQKENGQRIPAIVEDTSKQMGAKLATLTELCFTIAPDESEDFDLEQLISELEERLENVDADDNVRLD